MPLPKALEGHLRIPVIGSSLFIVSGPELVIAECKAGIVGSFPALNARPEPVLEEWIVRVKTELSEFERTTGKIAAPFAVNQICHSSNDCLPHDIEIRKRQEVRSSSPRCAHRKKWSRRPIPTAALCCMTS